jgi:hypothetical protein
MACKETTTETSSQQLRPLQRLLQLTQAQTASPRSKSTITTTGQTTTTQPVSSVAMGAATAPMAPISAQTTTHGTAASINGTAESAPRYSGTGSDPRYSSYDSPTQSYNAPSIPQQSPMRQHQQDNAAGFPTNSSHPPASDTAATSSPNFSRPRGGVEGIKAMAHGIHVRLSYPISNASRNF